jgi:hypothetical protein
MTLTQLGKVYLVGVAVCGWSTLPASLASPALQIGQNFTGSYYGVDSSDTPADANGAIGPQHFVELINGRFSVYDKQTGSRVQSKTDIQFWSAAGITFSSTVGTTDPRMLFDSDSQRWFASMVDFIVNRPGQRSNRFLLAVSDSTDPTGTWHGFAFGSDTNNMNFGDFPTLGVDPNGLYLSGDMFDRLGNPLGPTLVFLPKADLLANPPSIDRRKSFGLLSYSSRGNILQPAVTTGLPTTPEVLLAVGDLGLDYEPHNTLVLSTISVDAATNAVLSSPPLVLNVPSYTVPINPTQPDGSDNLDNGDARLGASVRRVGDVLYATHAVEVDNRAAVRWYRINAADGSLVESGTITDPVLDLFYPSIAANEAGTVVIGCNGSSATNFVSSYAVAGQITNGRLSFGQITLLKAGSGSYQNPDTSGISRWGDYSATTVDPVDPNRFWTIQMIALSSIAWATQITELITGAEANAGPPLTVTDVGANLAISWPATSSGFQLQQSPTLLPGPIWTPVSQTPTLTNNVNLIVLPMSGLQGFFRLMGTLP